MIAIIEQYETSTGILELKFMFLVRHQRGSLVVEHSLCVWEARARFPAESNQRFQIGS